MFPVDQGRNQHRQKPDLPVLPELPQLGSLVNAPSYSAAATKAMPSVDEAASRDWSDFQDWMDSEPYPVEVGKSSACFSVYTRMSAVFICSVCKTIRTQTVSGVLGVQYMDIMHRNNNNIKVNTVDNTTFLCVHYDM